MNNLEKNGFKTMPIIDGHLHIGAPMDIDKMVKSISNILEYYQYERVILCACIESSNGLIKLLDNLKSFYIKSRLNTPEHPNRVYVYGSILHYHDERDTPEGYLAQVKRLVEMGAEGIKLLDGKPGCRKALARPLDDPIFDQMYAYLEEHRIPIVSHVGDPEDNWDITKVGEHALKQGWFYDESFPTLQQLRDEVDGILKKFPKLKLCLAHFYFWGNELEKTKEFMDRWENVSFDLTPGGEMFVGFTARPKEWREFFIEYSDRLNYGTDTHGRYYETLDEYEGRGPCGLRINQAKRMLETSEPFDDPRYGRLQPLNLPDETLSKIYYTNVLRDIGDPHPMDRMMMVEYAKELSAGIESGKMPFIVADRELELANLQKMLDYFMGENSNE